MSKPPCEECGGPVVSKSGRARFCTPRCRYKHRDRARYQRDPERQRERSRRYYLENRELVLGKAGEKRMPGGAPGGVCSECGERLNGRRGKVVCSRRCKDARYRRLHPETYREKQRRKAARRRERKA
jgi:uncharacterized Zn finger protein (UPF0148 family)